MNRQQQERHAALVIRKLLEFAREGWPVIDAVENYIAVDDPDEVWEIAELVRTAHIMPFWREDL